MRAISARAMLGATFGLVVACSHAHDIPRPLPVADIDASPCTARVNKGPWVLGVDATSATVRFESCASVPSAIAYGSESGDDSHRVDARSTRTRVSVTYETKTGVDAGGTYFMNEARLVGLSPSTCYGYAVEGTDVRGRFCTARAPGEPLTFVALGDTKPTLGHTARMIERVYPVYRPDFTLHAGDLQYYEARLESWSAWFPAMSKLLAAGAFFPARGNHESEEPNELDEYFRRFFHDAGTDPLGDAYRFDSAGVSFFVLDTETDFGPGSPQAAWLVRGLEHARARAGHRFSVVLMHRPFVTCGDSDDHVGAREALAPAFAKYKVALVIQGHQHGYERFEIAGTTYVTTGGGGAELQDNEENVRRGYCPSRVAEGSFHHVMLFEVRNGTLSGRAIDEQGRARDAFRKDVP